MSGIFFYIQSYCRGFLLSVQCTEFSQLASCWFLHIFIMKTFAAMPASKWKQQLLFVSLNQATYLSAFFSFSFYVTCTVTAILPASRFLLFFGMPLCISKYHPRELHAASTSVCLTTASILPLRSVGRRPLTGTALLLQSGRGKCALLSQGMDIWEGLTAGATFLPRPTCWNWEYERVGRH